MSNIELFGLWSAGPKRTWGIAGALWNVPLGLGLEVEGYKKVKRVKAYV